MVYCLNTLHLNKRFNITLPASKSLSNRALIIKALCEDDVQLSNLSDCDDTRVMLAAFQKQEPNAEGVRTIDIGAAGTSMRFLTAYFATRSGAEVILTGSQRMKERPIRILVDALRTLGAQIEYLENNGFPPLRIHGKQLAGGALSIDGSTSSQYISALLLIAPTLTQGLQLTLTGHITSRPYIEMTLRLMQYFGIQSQWHDNLITVAPQPFVAKSYEVEGDWSAASYWYELLYCNSTEIRQQGGIEQITLQGLHQESLQGDSRVAQIFAQLGVKTEYSTEGVKLTHTANGFHANPIELNLTEQPDLAQTLVVALSYNMQTFRITGLHTLRIKETDRLAALRTELTRQGYLVEIEGDDCMYTPNRSDFTPEEEAMLDDADYQVVHTYKDHRMAMSFACACPDDPLFIDDPLVVSKSYPTFWDDLKRAGVLITEIPDMEHYKDNAIIEQWENEFDELANLSIKKLKSERYITYAKHIAESILIFIGLYALIKYIIPFLSQL